MTTPENSLNVPTSLLEAFNAVSGHMYDTECRFLQSLAQGKRVLEGGTHHGRATVAMAATALYVDSVESYLGDSQIGAPDFETTKRYVANSGLGAKIRLIRGDFFEYLETVDINQVDFVFYDASHIPPLYEKDFLDWAIRSGYKGSLALHDCYKQDPDMALVTQAVEDFARQTGRKINKPVPGTSIAWFDSI